MRLVIAMVLLGGLVVGSARARAENAPAGAAPGGSSAPAAKSGKGGAQQGAAAPAAAQDLARALVSNEDWNHVLDEYASGLAGHVADSLTARGDTVPEDLEPSIRKQLGQELPYEHVVDAQAQALAKEFTSDELEKAASFYSSPLGKKVTSGVPRAQSELGRHLQARLATAVPQIVKRVAPRAIPGEEPEAGSARAGASGGAASGPKAGSTPGRGDAGERGTGSASPPPGTGASEGGQRAPGAPGDRP